MSKVVKWNKFLHAMTQCNCAVEKLQGSAWQFTLLNHMSIERSIHFHEPHPNNDIPFIMSRRFGRRLERVFGWNKATFKPVSED
jgi:hypothetical protein